MYILCVPRFFEGYIPIAKLFIPDIVGSWGFPCIIHTTVQRSNVVLVVTHHKDMSLNVVELTMKTFWLIALSSLSVYKVAFSHQLCAFLLAIRAVNDQQLIDLPYYDWTALSAIIASQNLLSSLTAKLPPNSVLGCFANGLSDEPH